MPLQVIGAALVTHPVARLDGEFTANPLYDAAVRRSADVDTRKAATHLKRFESR